MVKCETEDSGPFIYVPLDLPGLAASHGANAHESESSKPL